ncbi:MAG: hypothetical protein KIT09_24140 [Bryobacteraceae bacterium]|nr:hypothetical protein [Bryobacteraceae bacterium]
MVSPPSGVTPAVVVVGLNPNVVPYMPAGRYREFMWFAKPGETCGSTPPCASTTVELTLSRRPPPNVSHVTNAATLQPGPLAPGQVVSIFGEYLGTPPVSSQFDSGGLYPTTLGNSTVAFNGVPGALLYVSTNQINAVVPWAVGEKSVEILVRHDGANAPAVSVPLAETAPGIFTATGNGRGQGAIINNGISFNSVENPAPKGSVITMFGTGGGLWTEPFLEGSIFLGSSVRIALTAAVSVTIGGRPAAIQYAGPAPYQVAGMFQINARVPLDIGSGPQPLVVTVGQADTAQQQVTVAIQ